jgi:hypothetical protein
MAGRFRREIGLIVAWLVFPLVPVILEDAYYGRRFLSRRSVWVAIGPWCGPLALFAFFAVLFVCAYLLELLVKLTSLQNLALPKPVPWKGTWIESLLAWLSGTLAWVWEAFVIVVWCGGWLWPAWAAMRRAARVGRLSRAFYRGLSIALAFVGSLFGSFWAATSFLRSYFFDPGLMPMIVVALGLAVTSGCASTTTYGEVRRRELFHAMLVAWELGLALIWRWWSRRRP